MNLPALELLAHQINAIQRDKVRGKVFKVIGDLIEATSPAVSCGSLASIRGQICEVIGFRNEIALLMPLDKIPKIQRGDWVEYLPQQISIRLQDP